MVFIYITSMLILEVYIILSELITNEKEVKKKKKKERKKIITPWNISLLYPGLLPALAVIPFDYTELVKGIFCIFL